MKKRILQLMIILFAYHAHAMEKKYETHEAFIKRTAIKRTGRCFGSDLGYCNIVSFDNKKQGVLSWENDREFPVSLTVFDMSDKREKNMSFNLLFPLSYTITSLDFNYQGTHLLMRFTQYDYEGKKHKKRLLITLNYEDLCWNK